MSRLKTLLHMILSDTKLLVQDVVNIIYNYAVRYDNIAFKTKYRCSENKYHGFKHQYLDHETNVEYFCNKNKIYVHDITSHIISGLLNIKSIDVLYDTIYLTCRESNNIYVLNKNSLEKNYVITMTSDFVDYVFITPKIMLILRESHTGIIDYYNEQHSITSTIIISKHIVSISANHDHIFMLEIRWNDINFRWENYLLIYDHKLTYIRDQHIAYTRNTEILNMRVHNNNIYVTDGIRTIVYEMSPL